MITKYLDFIRLSVPATQRTIGVTADGIWGPATQAAWLVHAGELWRDVCRAEGWEYTPDVVQHPRRTTRGRHVQPGSGATSLLPVLHWPVGDLTARELARLWSHDRDSTSSHVGIDEREVVWYAPPHAITHHARGHNTMTLGVDICAPCTASDSAAAMRRGIHAGPAPGGLLALSPVVARRVAEVLQRLYALGVCMPLVTDHAALDPGRKIDVIEWRDTLEKEGVRWLFR